MKHFVILTNKNKDLNFEITKEIQKVILSKEGTTCEYYDIYGEEYGKKPVIPDDTDCVLVLGGDGTILRTANMLIGRKIPLLGVNRGTLGFLADIKYSEIPEVIDTLIADDYQLENRVMVKAEVYKDDHLVENYVALNDIVIRGSEEAKMIRMNVSINGAQIDEYNADGLIICTPTGSTGYNLSAGGPIISPTCKNYVFTPICPHSLTARSVVMAKEDKLDVELIQNRRTFRAEARLIFDGKPGIELCPGDRICVSRAEEVTSFIKMKHYSFIKVLKEKMY